MEYPGSKLSHKIRVAILVTYITAFFILCPLTILYSSGYRYDWQHGFPKRTGAISINVEPADAQVSLNEVEVKRGINEKEVRLNSVPPGKYIIKITKSGYFDWVKDVEVKEMQTVYIKETILMKKETPQALDEGWVGAISLSPDGRYLAYAKAADMGAEIWLRDTSDNANKLFLNFKNREVSFAWGEKNKYLIISDAESPYDSVVIAPLDAPDKYFDLVKKIKYPVDKYQWKKSLEPELFFSTDLKIMSIFPATQKMLTLAKNTFLDWHMENGQLWTLETNTTTAKIDIYKDAIGFKEIFNSLDANPLGQEWNKTQILMALRDNVLLKDRAKMETLLVTKNKKITLAGEKFFISEYNNWWLIWSPWELWGYAEGGDPVLLNRSGEQLREVLSMDKFNALTLTWANSTTALYPYYLVTHTFIDTPITDADVDTKNRIFYFSGSIKGQSGLWQLVY